MWKNGGKRMAEIIRRNEIYIANLGQAIGSEERGTRPVLIVQNNLGNKYSPTTIVIPFTRRIENKNTLPTHIQINPFGKMLYKSTIMAEQIKVIDKKRLKNYIDVLPDEYIEIVDKAIGIATGLYVDGTRKEKYER